MSVPIAKKKSLIKRSQRPIIKGLSSTLIEDLKDGTFSYEVSSPETMDIRSSVNTVTPSKPRKKMPLDEKPASGTKYDDNKPMMAYLPANAITQVAMVMTFGAKKYGGYNYLGGISYIRLISAGLRHTFAILRGQDLDNESGLPHWAHAAACFLMLGEMTYARPELDDRYKGYK